MALEPPHEAGDTALFHLGLTLPQRQRIYDQAAHILAQHPRLRQRPLLEAVREALERSQGRDTHVAVCVMEGPKDALPYVEYVIEPGAA
jgi:hypothetical protein